MHLNMFGAGGPPVQSVFHGQRHWTRCSPVQRVDFSDDWSWRFHTRSSRAGDYPDPVRIYSLSPMLSTLYGDRTTRK